MNIFQKNRTENWIIKLFKITDAKIAGQFNMESCIISVIDRICQETDLKATDFDINYKNSIKSLNGFKKALSNQKEIVYSFVGFNSDKTNTFFTISNPMLNYVIRPENSMVDICIQVSSKFLDLKSTEQIAEQLINNYDFDYGYITKLPPNYDCQTERKIKKSLFSTGVEINEIDHVWTFHSIGILDGYIKRLYSINYLNKSHLTDTKTKELTLEYGIVKNISDRLFKWTLNPREVDNLKNSEQIRNISIITTDLDFLKTEKAKKFKAKMELKKPIANNGYK